MKITHGTTGNATCNTLEVTRGPIGTRHVDIKGTDTWVTERMTRGRIEKGHMEKLEDDTCQLLISPRGLLPTRHIAILFATCAAHHVSCQRGQSHMESQRVPWRLPARMCTRGSGRPVTFQRRVNEAKMVSRRNFLSSWKKHFSDVLAVSSRQT